MAKRIFVTATNTDIGKTYTSKLLLKEFASRGLRVGAFKPIETGVGDIASDAAELLLCVQNHNNEFADIQVQEIAPVTYRLPAAPYIASQGKKLDIEKLDSALLKLERLCDIMIIEGAGGLYVPIDEDLMMIDLITHFNASVLLVTHCSLGCINDTLLSQKALQGRKLFYATAFNCKESEREFEKISAPYFIKNGIEILKVHPDIEKICDVMYNL